MTITEAIIRQLQGHAGLTSLVSNAIQFDRMPDNYGLDYLVLHNIDTQRDQAMGGRTGLTSMRLQASSCSGVSRAQADSIAAQVRDALCEFNGLMGGAGGVTVLWISVDGERGFYESGPPHIWRTETDFIVHYMEE
jgi:hypothetical protein